MASSFVARASFPTLDSLPRSYFLGHHRAALTKMKSVISDVDFILECRDYRVPLTSINPMFEGNLAGRQRWVIYTKRDLGSTGSKADLAREELVRSWHAPSPVFYVDHQDKSDMRRLLRAMKKRNSSSITGTQLLVVGMPNVGKSSLLNALRSTAMHKGPAAITGGQPGVTRKLASSVKIAEGEGDSPGIYLRDTPGVFIPYVPDPEAMLKLALCGMVKDSVIPATTLADYLLFHINAVDSSVYSSYHSSTNEVMPLLEAIAQKTGRLQKGGSTDIEAAAVWFIQRWRAGQLGHFVLDHVDRDLLSEKSQQAKNLGEAMLSPTQAKKAGKEALKQRRKLNRVTT